MGILSDWGRGFKQQSTSKSTRDYINSNSQSKRRIGRSSRNRKRNIFLRQFELRKSEQLYDNNSRRSISIHTNVSRTRGHQPDPDSESNHRKISDRHNFNVHAIGNVSRRLSRTAQALCVTSASLFSTSSALAEGVGGVSATANPIANSSGSVTNQAIQVLQGPYITNTYGGGVQCQGSTFNLTPYIQFADSRKDPWEDFYNEPQYNMSDFSGRTTKQTVTVKNYPWEDWYDDRTKADGTRWFPDGEDIQIEIDVDGPDGVPDAVSNGTMSSTWDKPIRTDMKANQSFNAGVSATLSIPLNRKLVRQCHEAAQAQINMQNQLISNKRLDFEIARLKNCGELKKAGIFFHPASPYHSVCADVVVTNAGGQLHPHSHNLPQPNFDSSETPPSSSSPSPSSSSSSAPSQNLSQEVPSSSDTHSSSTLPESDGKGFFRGLRLPWQSPASQQVSQPSAADQLGVWQVGPNSPPQMLSPQSSSQSED